MFDAVLLKAGMASFDAVMLKAGWRRLLRGAHGGNGAV
jgi:hypothetical protein